jgi:four helix bundle protein
MPEKERDLVGRTFRFAQAVRGFVNRLPRSISNYEDIRQLVRSSGSVAANYLEAQEGLSRKDFFYRIKVCRKESRESGLWLRLVDLGNDSNLASDRTRLVAEADELKLIFASIAGKDDTNDAV